MHCKLAIRYYTCIQWARVLYSVAITRQPNPPISQFNSPCNEFTSVWSMFPYNKTYFYKQTRQFKYNLPTGVQVNKSSI